MIEVYSDKYTEKERLNRPFDFIVIFALINNL